MLPKKCGTYLTFTAKKKTRVATYENINGARAAVKRACAPWVNNNRCGHIYRRGHAARSNRSCNFGCISETKEFTTNYTSILKIVQFNAQNVAQFDA